MWGNSFDEIGKNMTHYVFFDMKGYCVYEKECIREKEGEREREREREREWY